MSVLLVLVAHDGRTLQLDVHGQTRVDAVQQALVTATGISVSDQIIMCHGARLDPAKPLAAYKLPVGDPTAAEDQPVFLYHKAYLRPGAAPPPAEPLPVLKVTVPGLPSVGLRHPLQSAHSPLIRALPDYEAQFQQQLGEARAFWQASQQRLNKCRQLMSEQEVQARAADAARANVETHYKYIAAVYSAFVDKYVAQHRHHSQLLSQFASLSAAMETIELPSQLATSQWTVLADLQPHRGRLQEWHDSCSRSHEHFASKVAELESVFQLLRQEVERLFLQAPSVDLDALGLQLNEAEGLIDEQGSVVQVLSKDLLTVKQLVEDVVAQLGGSAGGASLSGAAVHDTCAAVDTMHDNHLHSLLPRVRTCDASIAEFLLRCGDAKSRMTRDVLQQLQGIAAQQSRIRDMKHKLAVFNEVLARQAAAFAELQTATRLPAAYRLALAECARRAAWQEMFAGQANRLAEHCGRITAKEASKREGVRRQLERYLPVDLLARAGLLQEPPHCTVSVPPAESRLLPVTPSDLARLPAIIQQAAETAAQPTAASAEATSTTSRSTMVAIARRRSSGDGEGASQQLLPQIPSPRSAVQAASSSRAAGSAGVTGAAAAATSTLGASTWLAAPRASPAPVGVGGAGGDANLALENARLRAELAAILAQQAAKELGEDTSPSMAGTAVGTRSVVGASTILAAAAGATAAGAGSISLAASAAGPSQPAGGSASAAAVEAPGPAGKPYGHGGVAAVPASVAAPVPSVTAALQQVAQEQQQATAVAASKQALASAPVQAALAAKDELVAVLEARCRTLAANVAGYEARIGQLEAQLSSRFGSSIQVQQQQGPPTQEEASVVESSSEQQPVAAEDLLLQSVAPAFVLDATQAASFFGHPAAGPRAEPPSTEQAGTELAGLAAPATTVQAAQGSAADSSDVSAAAVVAEAVNTPPQHAEEHRQESTMSQASGAVEEEPKQQAPAGEEQQQQQANDAELQQQQQTQQQPLAPEAQQAASDAAVDRRQQNVPSAVAQEQEQLQVASGQHQQLQQPLQHSGTMEQQVHDEAGQLYAAADPQESEASGGDHEQKQRLMAQQQQVQHQQLLVGEPQQQEAAKQQVQDQLSAAQQHGQQQLASAEAPGQREHELAVVQQQQVAQHPHVQQELVQQDVAVEQEMQSQPGQLDEPQHEQRIAGQQHGPEQQLQQQQQLDQAANPQNVSGELAPEQGDPINPNEQLGQQEHAELEHITTAEEQQEELEGRDEPKSQAVDESPSAAAAASTACELVAERNQQPSEKQHQDTEQQTQQSGHIGIQQQQQQQTEAFAALPVTGSDVEPAISAPAAAAAPEAAGSSNDSSSSRSSSQESSTVTGEPPSVACEEAPASPAAAAAPSSTVASSTVLSVSEPDLRAVMVAQPAAVEADQQQAAAAAAAARRPVRSSSVDPSTALPIPRRGSRHSDDGVPAAPAAVAPAPAGSGGLTSLLSSSMHFLFHRSSGSSSKGDSSRGDSSGTSGVSPAVSPPAVSPPMSPPARASPVAVAAAAGAATAAGTGAVGAAVPRSALPGVAAHASTSERD